MAAAIDPATPAGGRHSELMHRFTSFLDADNGRGPLVDRIQQMITPPDEETFRSDQFPKRLVVSLDDLRDFDADLANDLMLRPVECLPIFENAMYELITGIRQDLAHDKRKLSEYRIGLEGAFGSRQVSPRGLNASLVGGVVSVEGIVTRASVVRPRLVLSVHYCPITKKIFTKKLFVTTLLLVHWQCLLRMLECREVRIQRRTRKGILLKPNLAGVGIVTPSD